MHSISSISTSMTEDICRCRLSTFPIRMARSLFLDIISRKRTKDGVNGA